jgi:hypothetical protein
MSLIIAQNKLLQDQLSSLDQEFHAAAPIPSTNKNVATNEVPLLIRGTGGTSPCQLPTVEDTSVPFRQDKSQELKPLVLTSPDFLPQGEVYVPFPPGSGKSTNTYYPCPRWMSECDQVQPILGFNPKTQKQVLHTIWRPTTQTFQIILETIPRATPTQAKSQHRMSYCLKEIVDVKGQRHRFASKAALMWHVHHHPTTQQARLTASQPCQPDDLTAMSLTVGGFCQHAGIQIGSGQVN